MTEEIRLTLPREPDFVGVAHLVVGGLAVRLDLTYEELEDIELALDNLLEREGGDDVTVAVSLQGGALVASVGPFTASGAALGSDGEELGLGRILAAVADEVSVAERDGAHWVQLRKRIEPRDGER